MNSEIKLKLIVIKTGNLKPIAEFYSLLGINFVFHKHGKSPYHYSGTIGDTTFEIYPLKEGADVNADLRLGFAVKNFEEVLEKITGSNGSLLTGPIERNGA